MMYLSYQFKNDKNTNSSNNPSLNDNLMRYNLTEENEANLNLNKNDAAKIYSKRNNKRKLIYKSIFPKQSKTSKNINISHEFLTYDNRNENEYPKNDFKENFYSQNQYKNTKKIIKNTINYSKERIPFRNNSEQKGRNNDYNNYKNRYINLVENNKDLRFPQEFSNRIKNQKYKVNSVNVNIGKKMNNYIYPKTKFVIKSQNTMNNLNKIMNKKDFLNNIKEIDDLDDLDELYKGSGEYYSNTDNVNNYLSDKKPLPLDNKYPGKKQILKKKILLNSKNNNNQNNNLYNINKGNIKNDYNINKSSKNNLIQEEKYKSKMIKNPNPEKKDIKFSNNRTYKDRYIITHNSFYDIHNQNNNYLLTNEENGFYTLSQRAQQIENIPKNFSMKYEKINKNNISNTNNKQTNYINKIPTNVEHDNILLLKEKIQQLNREINNKNEKINKFIKIIKETKQKNEVLQKNNNMIREENLKVKEYLKIYKKEILALKDKLSKNLNNNNNNENNPNDNSNSINNVDKAKIQELEKLVEKYKKENNNLKYLLNNNMYDIPNDNIKKKSYSSSKNKNTFIKSFVSTKAFQEDEI